MLLLLLLLLGLMSDRLWMKHTVNVLNRPRSAEGGGPAKVVVQLDELQEVVHRQTLVLDSLGDFKLQRGTSGHHVCGRAISRLKLRKSLRLTRDDVSQAVGIIVEVLVAASLVVPLLSSLPLGSRMPSCCSNALLLFGCWTASLSWCSVALTL